MQRLGDDGVEEVVGVEDEVNAQWIVDQIRMQRRREVVDQAVFEVPDVPHEGGFVESPLRYTGNPRKDPQRQRPREDQG